MSSYERVAQEEEDDAATLAGSIKSTHSVKPAIYYDSGPFDVPSSEDEDEEDEGVHVDIEKGRKVRLTIRFPLPCPHQGNE